MKIRLPEQVRILIEFLIQEFQFNDKFFTIAHHSVCARRLLSMERPPVMKLDEGTELCSSP